MAQQVPKQPRKNSGGKYDRNLTKVYDYIRRVDTEFTLPLDDFKKDLENPDVIRQVYENLSKSDPGIQKRSLDQFTEMLGYVPEKKKRNYFRTFINWCRAFGPGWNAFCAAHKAAFKQSNSKGN